VDHFEQELKKEEFQRRRQRNIVFAIKAAQDLIAKANIDPLEIDLLIMATATPDMPVASTGLMLQLKLAKRFGFDLQAAFQFLYGMSVASAHSIWKKKSTVNRC
jgi:3-oxoacyl-[acyl-carrier-protein] synthase III